jgi:hypothetical protein
MLTSKIRNAICKHKGGFSARPYAARISLEAAGIRFGAVARAYRWIMFAVTDLDR